MIICCALVVSVGTAVGSNERGEARRRRGRSRRRSGSCRAVRRFASRRRTVRRSRRSFGQAVELYLDARAESALTRPATVEVRGRLCGPAHRYGRALVRGPRRAGDRRGGLQRIGPRCRRASFQRASGAASSPSRSRSRRQSSPTTGRPQSRGSPGASGRSTPSSMCASPARRPSRTGRSESISRGAHGCARAPRQPREADRRSIRLEVGGEVQTLKRSAVMKQAMVIMCFALVVGVGTAAASNDAKEKAAWTESKAERFVRSDATVRLPAAERAALEAELRPLVALYRLLAIESRLTGDIANSDAYYELAHWYSRALGRCSARPGNRHGRIAMDPAWRQQGVASAPSGAASPPSRSSFRRRSSPRTVSFRRSASRATSARSRPSSTCASPARRASRTGRSSRPATT